MTPQLDWWLHPDWFRFLSKPPATHVGLMSNRLKLWAGNQTSLQIALKLSRAFAKSTPSLLEDLFDYSVPLTGRYGLDPRAAWNALEVGFSPKEQGMSVDTYPAVEMLGAIGLQRFRPVQDDGDYFNYAIWQVPLVPSTAAFTCATLLPANLVQRWRFSIADRGSYKGFDYAIPIGGET